MKKIPLFKVFMSEAAPRAVAKVMRSGHVAQGPVVDLFEKHLAKFLGVQPWQVVTTNSGTSALDLALHVCDVKPNDWVVSTPVTCTATNSVIVNRGARIVWADVDAQTGCITEETAEAAINVVAVGRAWKLRAAMSVSWGGRVFEPGLNGVLDAAHAFGARFDWNRESRIACFSFQAIKHLTTGDGGAVVFPRYAHKMADRARKLRWFGLDRTKGQSMRCLQGIEESGFKYHMNDIAAAIGIENLKHMPKVIAKHKSNAAFYHKHLAERVGPAKTSTVLLPPRDAGSSWWLYTLNVGHRDNFIKHMAAEGIECSQVHSINTMHPCFQEQEVNTGLKLIGAEAFCNRNVCIPVHWALTQKDLKRIAHAVNSFK